MQPATMSTRENPKILSDKSKSTLPRPPIFLDKTEERDYLKFRLAQAFRIFGSMGFEDGIVSLRVRLHVWFKKMAL